MNKFKKAIIPLIALCMASCRTDSVKQDALDFLYANMPLPDSVDYSRDYWERQVDVALQAREEMPWGQRVPEKEWLHFVLPVRVNNENLDDSRAVFYEELKNRVKDKPMYDAVLEVNHWCHEHVTYQPSDSRTKSPLVTMRSAIGRCGEESTFTVAALRAVGIPARQVYTPRWAHTDDNHAWVEVWVNGTWYYMGACEPEPRLNMGWFTRSATRAMLMHTKVFGRYDGPEEVLQRTACYTEINITSNYARVKPLVVRVQDEAGRSVPGAQVDFRLYNYAEFYPVLSRQTDGNGLASLTTGCGDLIVWCSRDGRFGFEKASVGSQDTVTVRLQYDASYTGTFDFDIHVPAEVYETSDLTREQVRRNKQRLAAEDSIRGAYMQHAFAPKGSDTLLIQARANHAVIAAFLKQQNPSARTLLESLSTKDLSDVPAAVLEDHLAHTVQSGHPLWAEYVLCPRVRDEMLTVWRGELSRAFAGKEVKDIIRWIRENIHVDGTRNPQSLCMSPLGVWNHRQTDAHSRDVFFVAAARSAGIPSRIDPVTGHVQWADADSKWHIVQFDKKGNEAPAQEATATLALDYTLSGHRENPSYYTHFTLSRIQNGQPQLQSYPEDARWKETFFEGTPVAPGQYVLLSGTRLADGDVLAHMEIFGVQENAAVRRPLMLRSSQDRLQVIGSFDSELGFTNYRGQHKPILETVGRGYYMVCLLQAGAEPTDHTLRDMERSNIYLSRWQHCFLMLFPSQQEYARFRREDYDELPSNFVFGVADPQTVRAMQIPALTRGSEELPIFMLCDTFGHVLWFHQGYTIGMDERIMNVIRDLL